MNHTYKNSLTPKIENDKLEEKKNKAKQNKRVQWKESSTIINATEEIAYPFPRNSSSVVKSILKSENMKEDYEIYRENDKSK